MVTLIGSLADIADRYDALYCDIWGVLHDGLTLNRPGAAALQAFRAGGGRVALVTNAPRPAPAVAAQLARLGCPEDVCDVIVTSGDAAREVVAAGGLGTRVFHIGPPRDASFFDGLDAIARVPLEEAEGVVCTGLNDDMTEIAEDYRPLLTRVAARRLPLLCANPDIVVDVGDRRVYCAGALAALYAELGGQALYVGKPHAPIYALARRRSGAPSDARWLAIGDGVGTDVEGAKAEGVDMLFVTGGLAHDQFGPDRAAPDPKLLDHWLRVRDQNPQWAIPVLA